MDAWRNKQRPDGKIYSRGPDRRFYELEAEWFRVNGLGQGHGAEVALIAESPPRPSICEEERRKRKHKKSS